MSEPTSGAPPPAPSSSRLDAMVVGGSLVILGAVLLGLFVVQVPQANLPIIAGIAGGLMGTVVGGYAGYRWGSSAAAKAARPEA